MCSIFRYRAIASFVGGEGQHSCQPGDLFLVVERDPDGWWLALKLGIESEGRLMVLADQGWSV